ncbi:MULTISPECIES: hypothetical protein [unclassified Clostridium]|uniref:hypothetical protein n=1 Tax=unclassified Clostridium TaxID=2614128 RepID=UPI003F915596
MKNNNLKWINSVSLNEFPKLHNTDELHYINNLALDKLIISLNLFVENDSSNILYCSALVLICKIYLNNLELNNIKYYLDILEKNFPYCSDIIYFKYIIEYNKLMSDVSKLNESLINEKLSNKFSRMYSTNDHIELLKAKILLSLGEYNGASTILKSIKNISSDLLLKLQTSFK